MLVDDPTGALADPAGQLAAVGHAIVVTNLDRSVVTWNPAAEELFGWTVAEAVGRSAVDLYLAGVPDHVLDDLTHTHGTGDRWSRGLLLRRKDGAGFVALVASTPVQVEGRLVGAVTVAANVGPAARPLLERSTDAALMLRADGTISYASPAVRRLFGWDEEALLGTEVLPLLHQRDRDRLADIVGLALTTPGPYPPVGLRVRADAGWVWVEAAVTNLLDDPGVRAVVCHLRLDPYRAAAEAAELRAGQLQTALDSRVVLEQAKGFLAGQRGCSPDEAFALLRAHARSHHESVHSVARAVLDRILELPSG